MLPTMPGFCGFVIVWVFKSILFLLYPDHIASFQMLFLDLRMPPLPASLAPAV